MKEICANNCNEKPVSARKHLYLLLFLSSYSLVFILVWTLYIKSLYQIAVAILGYIAFKKLSPTFLHILELRADLANISGRESLLKHIQYLTTLPSNRRLQYRISALKKIKKGTLSSNRVIARFKVWKYALMTLICLAVVALLPTFVHSHRIRGKARLVQDLYEQAKFQEVIEIVCKRPELKNDDVGIQYNLALSYYRLGYLDEAKRELASYIEKDPFHATSYFILGQIHLRQGHKVKAIELYKKALDIDGNMADAYFAIGVAYMQEGNSKKAIRAFRKVIAIYGEENEWSKRALGYIKKLRGTF